MHECPACLGEGEVDFRAIDVPLMRLARVVGHPYEPIGVVECHWCDGTGELTEDEARDIQAASNATVDQFKAGLRDGRFAV